jgi:hypothetical protein
MSHPARQPCWREWWFSRLSILLDHFCIQPRASISVPYFGKRTTAARPL